MKVKLPKKIQEFLWSNGSLVQDGDKECCFLPLYFVKSPSGIDMIHLENMPNWLSEKLISLREYQGDKPNPDNFETTIQGVIKDGKVYDIFELDDYTLLPTEQTKDNE